MLNTSEFSSLDQSKGGEPTSPEEFCSVVPEQGPRPDVHSIVEAHTLGDVSALSLPEVTSDSCFFPSQGTT